MWVIPVIFITQVGGISLYAYVSQHGPEAIQVKWIYDGPPYRSALIHCFTNAPKHRLSACRKQNYLRYPIIHQTQVLSPVIPTYAYWVTIELFDANTKLIENTSSNFSLDSPPIKYNRLEFQEGGRLTLFYEVLKPIETQWFTSITMEWSCQPQDASCMKTHTIAFSKEMAGRKLNISYSSMTIPGFLYIVKTNFQVTVYSPGTAHRRSSTARAAIEKTLAPEGIENLVMVKSSIRLAVELRWRWPLIGYWTNYTINCTADADFEPNCKTKTFPVNFTGQHGENFRHTISDLYRGLGYIFAVNVESNGVPAMTALKTPTATFEPASAFDMKVQINHDENLVLLIWRWPLQTYLTHYTVQCTTDVYIDPSCNKRMLLPVSFDDLHNKSFSHTLRNLIRGLKYVFTVNVESQGVSAKQPINSTALISKLAPIRDLKVEFNCTSNLISLTWLWPKQSYWNFYEVYYVAFDGAKTLSNFLSTSEVSLEKAYRHDIYGASLGKNFTFNVTLGKVNLTKSASVLLEMAIYCDSMSRKWMVPTIAVTCGLLVLMIVVHIIYFNKIKKLNKEELILRINWNKNRLTPITSDNPFVDQVSTIYNFLAEESFARVLTRKSFKNKNFNSK